MKSCTAEVTPSHTAPLDRLENVPGPTLLDDVIRSWLRHLMTKEGIKEAELARWMGYAKSRSQLVGYLKEKENRAFRIDYLGRIAARLEQDPVEFLTALQVFAAEQRGRREASPPPPPAPTPAPSSPLAGRQRRLDRQAKRPPADRPAKKTG